MTAPKKLWFLWREGGYIEGRVVASEVDHDAEGFPAYVPSTDLTAAHARIAELEAALRGVTQALVWQCFGSCRGYSDSLLTPAEAEEIARAALGEENDGTP